MMQLILGGATGLLLGLALVWSGLHRPDRLRQVWSLSGPLKTVLACLGFGAVMVSFASWLAVLDVDLPEVRPLSGGVLAGGAMIGLGIALSGRTPLTTLAGLGGGKLTESLSTLAGLIAGASLLPLLSGLPDSLEALPPQLSGTLFRVTLDKPFLWPGGFLAQGCLGALLLVLALWIPMPKAGPAEETPPSSELPEEPRPEDPTEEAQDAASGESVIAAPPEEEPLVLSDLPDENEIPDLPLIDENDPPEEESPPADDEGAIQP